MASFALAVLSGLYFFDQFDTAAFNVLAPNIEHAFHLSDRAFSLLVIGNLTLVLCFAVLIGSLGDRVNRVVLVVLGGALAGGFSFLTGFAGSLVILVVARLGNGIGQVVNDPVHNSLLADYYGPKGRPSAFARHQSAVFLGAIVGPAVAGIAASLGGWRTAFFVSVLPVAVLAVVATRLREPVRGGNEERDGIAIPAATPMRFREARKTLMAVPTLRRQYIGFMFIGAGVLPLAFLLPLYFERVYGLGVGARGAVMAAGAVCQFGGVILAGRLTPKWGRSDPGNPLRWAGRAVIGVGLGLGLIAAAPNLGFALALNLLTNFVAGLFYPPFYTVQASVSPPRVRTLSYGLGAFFLVLGVWLLWLVPESGISTHHGMRLAVAALLPYWVIGGLILMSASRFVAADAENAADPVPEDGVNGSARSGAGVDGPNDAILRCRGVDVAYDKVKVLFGVDLDVAEGEIVALLGTNGAGKSTLLKAIAGLVDVNAGSVHFNGRDITHLEVADAVKMGIVVMPGGRSIFPTLTVSECLRLAGWLYRRNDMAFVEAATERTLTYFPTLRNRLDVMAGDLSGGEQQMLGLSMALIAKPRLLMIDELSLGLAPAIVGQLIDIVRQIHADGATIVIVEQSVNVALELAQRAVFMEKGEVRFSGPAAELIEREDILRSVFLEGASNASSSSTRRIASAVPLSVSATPASFDPTIRNVLELSDVVVEFGGIRAVDHVSMSLRPGEILGVIGPNGAGKTTLFDTISGFVPSEGGSIRLADHEIGAWSPARRASAGLGRSFQDARLFSSLTVAENIAVAFERQHEVRDPLAAALSLPKANEAEWRVAWQVHDLIDLLGLGSYRNKFVSELSTGSRRIVDIAMALAHRPSVLLFDEPSSGIAQKETEALGPLLVTIQKELGCALLVIEHDMPLILGIAHRIMALESGHVVTIGAPQDVISHPEVVASYLGTNDAVINRSGLRPVSKDQTREPSSLTPELEIMNGSAAL